ncbi:MAG: carboxypeptidase-like regulatory domain-containing protein, partial [Candidatus Firestonebacteria bacterium]
TSLATSVSGADFAKSISLSGSITGAGKSGVSLVFTGGTTATVSADSNGAYSTVVPAGRGYTITPEKTGYVFFPASLGGTYSVNTATLNFSIAQLPVVSGKVKDGTGTGVSGITVVLSDGTNVTNLQSDSGGNYRFEMLAFGQTYTITPVDSTGTYNPTVITCVSLGGDVTGNDFTKFISLSGTISGAGKSGAAVILSAGGTSVAVAADSNGAYSTNCPAGLAYTVTPGKLGYSFSPVSYSGTYSVNTSTLDFSITQLPLKSISGTVKDTSGTGITGVTLTLTGSAAQTGTSTTTATGGAYAFTGLLNGGDYVITPAREGYMFVPVNTSVTNLTTDISGRDFIGNKGYPVDATKDNDISFLLPKGELKVDVPAGAFSQTVTITASQLPTVPDTGQLNVSETSVGVEITLTGDTATASKVLTLTFKYSDADMVGFDEGKLVIGWYDETLLRWVILTTTRDANNNLLVALTTHFSKYAILQLSPAATLEKVLVYPNPYRSGSGGGFDSTGITFSGLTASAKIKIFTLAGALVRELEEKDNDGVYAWDASNTSGEKLASGVYLYFISDPNGNKKTGKFAVVR